MKHLQFWVLGVQPAPSGRGRSLTLHSHSYVVEVCPDDNKIIQNHHLLSCLWEMNQIHQLSLGDIVAWTQEMIIPSLQCLLTVLTVLVTHALAEDMGGSMVGTLMAEGMNLRYCLRIELNLNNEEGDRLLTLRLSIANRN